jgi:hypothetical protein
MKTACTSRLVLPYQDPNTYQSLLRFQHSLVIRAKTMSAFQKRIAPLLFATEKESKPQELCLEWGAEVQQRESKPAATATTQSIGKSAATGTTQQSIGKRSRKETACKTAEPPNTKPTTTQAMFSI